MRFSERFSAVLWRVWKPACRRRCTAVGQRVDAGDAVARGLRLARGDADLLADQRVHQRRLADVGPADDGDHAATETGGSGGCVHIRLLQFGAGRTTRLAVMIRDSMAASATRRGAAARRRPARRTASRQCRVHATSDPGRRRRARRFGLVGGRRGLVAGRFVRGFLGGHDSRLVGMGSVAGDQLLGHGRSPAMSAGLAARCGRLALVRRQLRLHGAPWHGSRPPARRARQP